MSREKLVIIGAGMAAGRFLEHLLDANPDAYDITLFNAEPRGTYNRIMLSPVLSGEKSYEEIVTHTDDWYAEQGITCRFGERIISVDRANKTVLGEKGIVAYDKLVIATGSSPFIIPMPGHDLSGVLAYRDLEDTNGMIDACQPGAKAVVIGGGLLGLEAAAGLRLRGMDVTVLHLMPTLMERQLDPSAGYLLEKELADRGIEIRTGANSKEIYGDGKVEGIRLEDGTDIPANLIVMAVGIRPSIAIAKEAGLDVGRGILVDCKMKTSDPSIYSVGECVEFEGNCYGLVAPLFDQAKVLANALIAEADDTDFVHSETATKLKVTGVDLFSAGDFADGEGRDEIVFRDPARGIYKRLVLEGDKLVGAVLYGETADGAWFFDKIKKGEEIGAEDRATLIFGQSYAGGSPLDPMAAVAALPDEAEICGCNGISKGQITQAIDEKGLSDVEGVRACTKASGSCGTCTGLVESLLAWKLGDAFAAPAKNAVCGCTELGHDEVRRLIVSQRLKSVPAVMQELSWKTSCGCAKCRPALNYYLLASWPGEYVDDNQSRFINERVHANIQKDGTYSVVPRAWGGVTTAAELRAVADVVDKYDIPMVKYTGGQRIDMLGVKKEDLPGVWADLNEAGMVSGHAYGKSLRTVKTCVGSEWCRVGTQDSTGLGIKLEKLMWGSWTPHKVKLAVSGCPRNCAEATCKDIGVVCVDSGYQIHIAGAAGMEVRATDHLTTVTTEEEAIEMCAAVLQAYREQGFYLERIYKWTARIGGAEKVHELIVDDVENRKALFERFKYAQQFSQDDPWAERASGKVDAHEFKTLELVE
ncbi:nitrite reductase large subunit NirB [Ponticaulis sp.]|nr:nitrite reductase large subunit NirB [Ponticaulis sp.]MAJ08100.1 nitrite reductase large subunit [Ponticaulis sp.]HBH90666.1 nitrite reductase large subunit [Hyphomonadaceae bacterium]|tara:strand:- start:40400 stop:42844 length:2445 start_codon:yes stop_codon:yes gene_type:complete